MPTRRRRWSREPRAAGPRRATGPHHRGTHGRPGKAGTAPASPLLFGAGLAIATAATAAIASSFVEHARQAFGALRMVGVGTASFRRAAMIENAVLLSLGTVIGIAAGVGTAWLARATIPVSTDPSPVRRWPPRSRGG